MSSNHNFAKDILDVIFNKIYQMLQWQSNLLGKYYYQVDTCFPSSKKCSHCDEITQETNNFEVRNQTCLNCGCENDRDINASINIMFEELRIHCQNS